MALFNIAISKLPDVLTRRQITAHSYPGHLVAMEVQEQLLSYKIINEKQ